MRISGGARRGKRLRVPPGTIVRPTSERARQAVFNILAHGALGGDPPGLRVLDVFAGIGAMGLEALSRGAAHATFIESDPRAAAALRANVRDLDVEEQALVIRADATRLGPPPRGDSLPADLVFLDPPYGQGLAAPVLTALDGRGWIAPEAVCVVEVAAKEPFAAPAGFQFHDERRYGAARIVMLLRAGATPA